MSEVHADIAAVLSGERRWCVVTGDCLDVLRGLPRGSIDATVTDPPYSSGGMYRSDRAASTESKYQLSHETSRTYAAFAGDNRDQRSFEKWCASWMSVCHAATREGGGLACFIDWRNVACVIDAVQVGGWVYRGLTPWHKGTDQRPLKGWFRRNIEYLVWGTCGPIKTGPDADGPCLDGMFFHRVNGQEKQHQTGKPVELMCDVVGVRSEWDLILDPFTGSGTTGVAAIKTGRRFIGIEIDEHYANIARERIAKAEAETLAKEPAPC